LAGAPIVASLPDTRHRGKEHKMAEQGTTAQAKEKASEVAGQAQEQAQKAAGQARDQLRTQVDRRSTEAGEKVRSQASDLRSVGEQLRSQGKDQPAKIAEQAADRVEQVGSWLHDSDADRILRDVEDFGRRNPWAVVAGGLALGFAASRFLKASSTERYRTGTSPSGDGRQLPVPVEQDRFSRADAPPPSTVPPPATGTGPGTGIGSAPPTASPGAF
jgi:hypothetical protein